MFYVLCPGCFLACRSRQASIVLERYFRFEVSLLSTLCMEWRWEPVEFRAIPILLRKLPNQSEHIGQWATSRHDVMLFLAECIRI